MSERVLKVIIAEDNHEMRDLMAVNLEELVVDNMHIKITEVDNGKDAYSKILENDFDLIITDLAMPMLDGRQLIRLLKNEKTINFKVPIIVISGDVSHLDIQPDDEIYTVEKPFTLERFEKVVRMIMHGTIKINQHYASKSVANE